MDDFGAMNDIWIDWLDPDNKPVRACVEAPMVLTRTTTHNLRSLTRVLLLGLLSLLGLQSQM